MRRVERAGLGAWRGVRVSLTTTQAPFGTCGSRRWPTCCPWSAEPEPARRRHVQSPRPRTHRRFARILVYAGAPGKHPGLRIPWMSQQGRAAGGRLVCTSCTSPYCPHADEVDDPTPSALTAASGRSSSAMAATTSGVSVPSATAMG